MEQCDVLVIGGGPAGSSAAWRLRRAGASVIVLDKAVFPRLKLCAGWITPEVVRDLEMDPATYPYRFLTFERMQVHLKGLRLPLRCVQHSIRRTEFDAWLLERSGARVIHHEAKQIEREPNEGAYVIDGAFRAEYLVGAGGTSCPVYRKLFREAMPRERALQAVALEYEFAYDWRDPDCHLWFFDGGLPGYSWYVPKRDGWINVGIGALKQRLRERGESIDTHWTRFARQLERRLVHGAALEPTGYSYYLRGAVETGRIGNALLTGDAVGLATRDLCEGIGPAVRSGLRAADAILGRTAYSLEDVTGASLGGGRITRWLDRAFTGGVGATPATAAGARSLAASTASR
ncbi:MAG: NAD(P)/FAD-dependent oxidoreductase [Sinobacteraceae bacterium]|nr:NAD(P)/FAD-dependent oxidoreductase [Nevskiaceae bacterium]